MTRYRASGWMIFEWLCLHSSYHYRTYNLAAMMTNARIGQYVGFNAWNLTTNKGGSIQKAADYVISLNASSTGEDHAVHEMYQIIGAISATYGDPSGKYKGFLQRVWASEPFFFWYQLAGGMVRRNYKLRPATSGDENGLSRPWLALHIATFIFFVGMYGCQFFVP